MNAGAAWARFGDGRWHFQHGPIDLVLEAFGPDAALSAGYERAWRRFATVLDELVAELRALREEVAQLRAVSQATASSTAQMADQLDQVTEGGNAMRTEVIA